MVRLVKGAYWDSEIKRAQVDGLDGYPGLHPQGPHRRLLSRLRPQAARRARTRSIPQFATHNAQTLAAIYRDGRRPILRPANTSSSACTAWASRCTRRSSAATSSDRPCRIYAPVGTHETLLAYLVRRLLENGANTSFVNRIADPDSRDRGPDRRSGRDGARAPNTRTARRIRRIALPRDCSGRTRQIPRASICPTNRRLALASRLR